MIETIRVDLHCHSSLSDGDHSPAYVAHSIAATGAEGAALTDHNSVSGQHQFRAVLEKRGVRSVVGLEMDARTPRTAYSTFWATGSTLTTSPFWTLFCTLRQPLRASARYWMDRLGAYATQAPAAAPRITPRSLRFLSLRDRPPQPR